MAAYNSDPTTVCAQTFDQAALESSFPGSTAARESPAPAPSSRSHRPDSTLGVLAADLALLPPRPQPGPTFRGSARLPVAARASSPSFPVRDPSSSNRTSCVLKRLTSLPAAEMDKVVMVFKGMFGWESTLCVLFLCVRGRARAVADTSLGIPGALSQQPVDRRRCVPLFSAGACVLPGVAGQH